MKDCLNCNEPYEEGTTKFCAECVKTAFTFNPEPNYVMGKGFEEVGDWGSHGRLIGTNGKGRYIVLDEDGESMDWTYFEKENPD